MTDAGLREAEDQAITTAVRRQEATGIDVLTDGEFRRRDEVAAITRAEITALIADGVRYIQLGNPGHGAYLGRTRATTPPGSSGCSPPTSPRYRVSSGRPE